MSCSDGVEVKVVLEHGRCSWAKCYFCGWGRRRADTSLEELLDLLRERLEKGRRRGATRVKVFSSGSLLDEKQYPAWFARAVVEEAASRGYREVVVEARPEHVKPGVLDALRVPGVKVTVAMGLEVADDIVLSVLAKGSSVYEYARAARLLRGEGFGVRSYVLVNPHPLLSSAELQVELLERSIAIAVHYSDSVAVINTYPHVGAPLYYDWLRGAWRPLDAREFHGIVERALQGLGAERLAEDCYVVDGVPVELDHQNFAFKPRVPRRLQKPIKGVGLRVLRHPFFEVWQDYIVRFYQPPRGKDYALLLPCSYRKPYRRSKTHRVILSVISGYPWFRRLHLLVVSTPGVVPYELQDEYPFNSYDWPEWMETEEVKKAYIEVTAERVEKFLRRHHRHYKLFIAYLSPESETMEAVRRAFTKLNLGHKLVEAVDPADYERAKRELGRERIGSSILTHPLLLEGLRRRLREVFSGEKGA